MKNINWVLNRKIRNPYSGEIARYVGCRGPLSNSSVSAGDPDWLYFIENDTGVKRQCREEELLSWEEVFDDIPTVEDIKITERMIVKHSVHFNNVSFDLEDLYETLNEVEEGDIQITYNRNQIDCLIQMGVLNSAGSFGWAAQPGPHYAEFMKVLIALKEKNRSK